MEPKASNIKSKDIPVGSGKHCLVPAYSWHEKYYCEAFLTSLVAWFPTTAAPYLPCFKYCPFVLEDKWDIQLQNCPCLRSLSTVAKLFFFRVQVPFPTFKHWATFLSLKKLQLPCLPTDYRNTYCVVWVENCSLHRSRTSKPFHSHIDRSLLLSFYAHASVFHKQWDTTIWQSWPETVQMSGQHPRLQFSVRQRQSTCCSFNHTIPNCSTITELFWAEIFIDLCVCEM